MKTLSDLKPNKDNPRRISKKQLEMLKKSLDRFGELNCLVINRRSGLMTGGHQRAKVLPQGCSVVWEHVYESPTPTGTVREGYVEHNSERYKIREVDWDETTEKAAVIAANQHSGEFDLEAVGTWINELNDQGLDLDLLGFTAEELANIMEPKLDGATSPVSSESVPELITCPGCGINFTPE